MKFLNSKKGFTIVELVIVIAVIAILAAVLIPTFSSVINKANESNAMQKARQALIVLTAKLESKFDADTTYYFVVKDGDKAVTDDNFVFEYKKGYDEVKASDVKATTAITYTAVVFNATEQADIGSVEVYTKTAAATTAKAS